MEVRGRRRRSSSDSVGAPGRSSISDGTKAAGRSRNSSGSMETPGHSSKSSGGMEAPRSSDIMSLLGNSSSVGMGAAVTPSSTHIRRTSSASITRGQGALVGLATPV